MFESTIELYGRYYKKHWNTTGFSNDLGTEVWERLQQLDYLIEAIQKREQRGREISGDFETHIFYYMMGGDGKLTPMKPPSKDAPRGVGEIGEPLWLAFEAQLFTECFYYLAGRLRTVLKNDTFPFPYLTSFECAGARDVRNQLLEHVEGKRSLVARRTFLWGGTQGPVLKADRYQGQENIFPDKGLYYNAAEIKTNLERRINEDLK